MKKTDAFVKWTCNFSIYARHIDADMSNDGQLLLDQLLTIDRPIILHAIGT